MLRKMIFVLLWVLSFGYSPALAQLGPKDSTDLSPTDPQRVNIKQQETDFTLGEHRGQEHHFVGLRGKRDSGFGFLPGLLVTLLH